jgi:hypothetical protein
MLGGATQAMELCIVEERQQRRRAPSPPAPLGRGHFLAEHHPGVRKKRSPLANFLPPLWGGNALMSRSRPDAQLAGPEERIAPTT